MRRILSLYLPNWPIQRVRAGRKVGQACEPSADPRGISTSLPRGSSSAKADSTHPTILHARDPRRGLIVVACDDGAASAGVRIGMPLAEAMTQVAGTLRVPSISNGTWSVPDTLPHDPAADLAELARLAEHCERFSPLVGWETVEGKVQSSKRERSKVRGQKSATWNLEFGTWNALFLDITGIGVLFGGEEQLAREALADLARFGYTARAAVADTIGAAWAAANWESEAPAEPPRVQGSGCKVQESEVGGRRLGSEDVLSTKYSVLSTQYKPPPLRTPHSALRTLPLESLRLPPETLDLLAQLGIRRLDELLALPRASLRARFGQRLLLRLDQLTGAAQEVIVPYRPPPKFAAEWVLEYPAERRDIIEQIVQELVGRVAAALAERREGVVQLHCRFDCGMGQRNAGPAKIDVGLFRPSADARHLWDLVRMQLEQTRLPGPVGRVTLEAVTTAPLENRQAQLFAGGQDEASRQLALLIDRLTSRLGPEAVLRPQLTADPLPERAVRKEFKVQSSTFKVRRTTSSTLNSCFRPLFLRPPLVLDVVSIVPDGPPITFHYAGQWHRVAHWWGPERIETGWYRGASVRRDYYRVQTEEGLRFWLFRRLDDDAWCLHGEFS
jgi:protein ImuB